MFSHRIHKGLLLFLGSMICLNLSMAEAFEMKKGSMFVLEAGGGIVKDERFAKQLARVFFEAQWYGSQNDPVFSVQETEESWLVRAPVQISDTKITETFGSMMFLIEIKKSDARILDLKTYFVN